MTITTEDLRKLLDEATPGPWGWDGLKLYGFAGEQVIDHAGYEGMWFASYGQPEKQVANAAIMAAAHTLAVELITARAKIEAAKKLADAVRDFATAKIDALRYQPAYGESPEDEPDPVVEADYVWALQSDAKDAIAAWESLK